MSIPILNTTEKLFSVSSQFPNETIKDCINSSYAQELCIHNTTVSIHNGFIFMMIATILMFYYVKFVYEEKYTSILIVKLRSIDMIYIT